jgi:Ca-activated chloride channel family protein
LSKVVVLLTDGEENVARADLPEEIAPLEAAQLCQELGVRVYTIAAGIGHRSASGELVELDTAAVRRLAEQTGGAFFAARDASAVARVYSIIDELERSELEQPRFGYADRFVGALVLGMVLWVLGRIAGATLWEALP